MAHSSEASSRTVFHRCELPSIMTHYPRDYRERQIGVPGQNNDRLEMAALSTRRLRRKVTLGSAHLRRYADLNRLVERLKDADRPEGAERGGDPPSRSR